MITSSCWVKLCIPSGEFIIGSCMFKPSCWEKLCIPDGDVITVFGRSYVSQMVMLSLCLGEVMYPRWLGYHRFMYIYTTVFGRSLYPRWLNYHWFIYGSTIVFGRSYVSPDGKKIFLPLVSVLSYFLIFSFIFLCHTRGIFLMATMLLFCYFLYSSMRRSSRQKRPTRKAAGEMTPDRGEPPRHRQRRDLTLHQYNRRFLQLQMASLMVCLRGSWQL